MPRRSNVFNTNPFASPLGGVTETFQPGSAPPLIDPNANRHSAFLRAGVASRSARLDTLRVQPSAALKSIAVQDSAYIVNLKLTAEEG